MVVAEITDDAVLGADVLSRLRAQWNWDEGKMEWPLMEEALPGDSGSGDVPQPDESASEEIEDEETTEYGPLDLQDMEVLCYVPRGMDEKLPREHWSLQVTEELEGSTSEMVEALCSIRANQTMDTEVDALPPGVPEHLVKIYQDSCSNLSQEQQSHLADLLQEYQEVFSRSNTDIGQTKLEIHRIPRGDAKPIRLPPRQAPMHLRTGIEDQIRRMKEQGPRRKWQWRRKKRLKEEQLESSLTPPSPQQRTRVGRVTNPVKRFGWG